MNQKEITTQLFNFLEEKSESTDNYNRCCVLSGQWGVGKTYIVNKLIERDKDIYSFIKVSLFGINSVVELKTRILREICKNAKNFVKAIRLLISCVSLSINIPSFGSIELDLSKVSEALNNKRLSKLLNNDGKTYVVVLDDIERKDNKLSIVEVLGTVDELLKNKNIKVLLVTNFDKLTLNNECFDFKDFKEKIAKRTYELNNVEDIVKQIIKLDDDYELGSNLRTIFRFKELLLFIDSCSVSYPFVIKQIIYKILKIEKEKIDLRRIEYLSQINAFRPEGNRPSDDEIRKSVDSMPFASLVVKYAVSGLSLIDKEKQYTKSSVEKAAKHIYQAIFDGNDNSLLCIPSLDYGVLIELPKDYLDGTTKEEAILKMLIFYQNSSKENTIGFKETSYAYCNYLYDNYSRYASNKTIKEAIDLSISNYTKTMTKKSIENPQCFSESLKGIEESLRLHKSNTLANKIKGDLSKSVFFALVDLKFDKDSFYKSNEIFSNFLACKFYIDSEFFNGFVEKFQNLEKGLEFIYNKCQGDVSDYEWQSFNDFFRNIRLLKLSDQFKKTIRNKYIKSNEVSDNRLRELISLL